MYIIHVHSWPSGLVCWIQDPFSERADLNPSVANCSVWDGGQWRDSVSLAKVDPALNGYLEKSGEGKQEGCAKVQDGWPSTLHCTSWLKGQETEISTAGRDCKV